MPQEDRSPHIEASAPRRGLSWFNLRSREIERVCPDDERNASTRLAIVGAAVFIVRTVLLLGAMMVFDIPLEIACVLALTISVAVWATDSIILNARDIAEAERTSQRTDATDIPRLTSGMRRFTVGFLRSATASVISVVTAGFVSIFLHSSDIESKIAEEQARIDAPYRVSAHKVLDAQQAELERRRKVADEDLAAFVKRTSDDMSLWESQISNAQTALSKLTSTIDTLEKSRKKVLAEKRRQEDLARCELAGDAPGCEMASRIPKAGPLYRLAIARAEAKDTEAKALAAEIEATENRRENARKHLETLRNAHPGQSTADLEALRGKRQAAAEALEAFKAQRPKTLAALLMQNPQRQILNVESMATKIWALGELATDPWFATGFFALKVFAFVLEMLPVLAGISMPTGEYALRRGQRLTETARDVRLSHADQSVADQTPMTAGYQARRKTAAAARQTTFEEEKLLDELRIAELRATVKIKQEANDLWLCRHNAGTPNNTH